MMADAHAMDYKKHVRTYLAVFGALAVLTVLTVAVSYLEHSMMVGVVIALIIATVKGALVACFFMHLISERKLIYTVLVFTAVFFAVMMGLLLASHRDQEGAHVAPLPKAPVHHEEVHVP